MDFQKPFGKKFKLIRQYNDLSQEETAEKIGLQYGFIGLVERGKNYMSLANLAKACDVFGVKPYEFFIFEDFYKDENTIKSEMKNLIDNMSLSDVAYLRDSYFAHIKAK